MAEHIGTKTAFYGEALRPGEDPCDALEGDLRAGRLSFLDMHPGLDSLDWCFDPKVQGGLLLDPTNHQIYYVPPPTRRGKTRLEPIPLHATHPDVASDAERIIGLELEKFTHCLWTGVPEPVRYNDPDTHRTEPLYPAASDTAELTRNLDEHNTEAVPFTDLVDVIASHLRHTLVDYAADGIGVSPYALSPDPVTADRIDQDEYIQASVMQHPEYLVFFDLAGTQIHRAIRRYAETPQEAVEFAAYAANRLPAFSWLLTLLSGSSPRFYNRPTLAEYGSSDRLTLTEKEHLKRKLKLGNAAVGFSMRTWGRYAGSESGGIQEKPLPEDFQGLLWLMHSQLKDGSSTNPGRVAGEHADIRPRIDNGKITHHGTFETSVPDAMFRIERIMAVIEIYDAIIEKLHSAWRGATISPRSDFQRLIGLHEQISSIDLLRYRQNALCLALNGNDGHITLANTVQLKARKLAPHVVSELRGLSQATLREVELACRTPTPDMYIRDESGLPSIRSHFELGFAIPDIVIQLDKELRKLGIGAEERKKYIMKQGMHETLHYGTTLTPEKVKELKSLYS
jgi:hypothetical protein